VAVKRIEARVAIPDDKVDISMPIPLDKGENAVYLPYDLGQLVEYLGKIFNHTVNITLTYTIFVPAPSTEKKAE